MIPKLLTDPKTREQLKDWMDRREQLAPGLPLTPREYLMVERLKNTRHPYSIT
jgi:hypothetical protein